jgi:hypothetical protein
MVAPVDPATVRSFYEIAKDFLPALAAGTVLLSAFIALISAQIVVWRQNNAVKRAADENRAVEKREEDRLDRQKQLAFLVMLYQELASLKVMIAERILLLGHFMKMADTAERQVLILTNDSVMRVRLDTLCVLSDLMGVMRNDWQELAILEPSLQITYHQIFNGLHLAEKTAQRVRVALEKSGMIIASEIEGIITHLKLVSDGLDKDLPGLYQKLENQIRASGLDYHHPATPP